MVVGEGVEGAKLEVGDELGGPFANQSGIFKCENNTNRSEQITRGNSNDQLSVKTGIVRKHRN
jgi:hypothetical protein